jgi:uncharacterized protein (TIRG00374 family)
MSTEAFSWAKRSSLRRAVTILVLGGVTFLVILKLSGFRAAWEKVRALDPRYIVAAFAVHYFSFFLRAQRWKVLLRALGRDLPATVLFPYLLAGWFISAVVPARAGDVARAYLLKNDRQIPLRVGLGSIFVERGLDGLVILSGSLIFSFFILSLGLPSWVLPLYQITFAIFLAALLFFLLVPRLESKARKLSSSARHQKVIVFLFRMMDKVRLIAQKPVHAILALFFTVMIWLCDAVITYLVFLSLDHPLPLPWVAFVSFTVNLVATVPITPGAVGQIDAVQFSLFSLIGVVRDFSGVAILISRFIGFWSFLLVSGLVAYGSGLARLVQSMAGGRKLMDNPMETVGSGQ